MIMTTRNFSHRTQTGFSLTELMVALLIGLIVLAAASQMFVSSNKAANNQNRLSRVQENGRFAMYYLLRDLRAAGFMGCIRIPKYAAATDVTKIFINNDLPSSSTFYLNPAYFIAPIEGVDNVTSTAIWSPSGDSTMPASLWTTGLATIAQPDMIAIRRVDSKLPLTSAMTSYSDNLSVPNTAGYPYSDYKANTVALVADCAKADLVLVSPAGTSSAPQLDPSVSLLYAYDKNASVYRFSTVTYYIRLNANGIPSLYRDENGANAVEVVEGIESIKFLYGVANQATLTSLPQNNQPSYYRKASQMNPTPGTDPSLTDWPNVVSVKIGILARTPNAKDSDIDNTVYDVNGTFIGPFKDRNARRVFTATVLLKNRNLPQ